MALWQLFEMSNELYFASQEIKLEQYRMQRAIIALHTANVKVERFNFLNNPVEFLNNQQITDLLENVGDDAFPVLMIDGVIKLQGRYPNSQELSAWSGLGVEAFPVEFTQDELNAWHELIEMMGGGCGSGGCSGCSGCGSGRTEDDYLQDLAD